MIELCGDRNPNNRAFTCGMDSGHGGDIHRFDGPGTLEWPVVPEPLVFFYDEKNDAISSISTYHQENCSIGLLVEAHPNVIYFYATIEMS